MKQTPRSLRHFSETSGETLPPTPRAVNTSELPERLVTARFPCFATGRPAPAITKAAAVDTLKVFAQLEPVPAVSRKPSCRGFSGTARERIAAAMPVSSSTVSPFTANATNAAAIWPSVEASLSKASKNSVASERDRFSPRINRARKTLKPAACVMELVTCGLLIERESWLTTSDLPGSESIRDETAPPQFSSLDDEVP